ncbi:sodium-dependent phosphate transporter [Clostridioides difficile]|uniref:Na/Pi cotransporter family protein n=1 Tax=unclassified Clostridioides TaxID=2635829 RepID=UPI0006BBAA0B|nr:sodium-dependent phosphate transporter [Clostridioides difficile]KPI52199.1 sodium-dependent phosphate transporter [Clostridioides difficile]NJJ35268.1 Na/Pi cotransporter family protein [Clostridioides difficile]NJK13809.1 Na/Pi cotransporter family protein [Clostridioides difficile]
MNIAISLIGGLGLFLYGMSLMGEGLQKSAGDKLKKIIELLTSNVVMGVLVGTVVTGIIQSSSATTVMVVGFVNAGIMNLSQAIGVIMGANIGTTVTAQLVSFNLEGIAPIALGVGIVFYLFTSNQKTKHLSEILIGFGILFTGMEFMKDAVAPLAEYKAFTDVLLYFSKNPLLGILAGFAITGIIQSSSASMGMLIALASQGILPLSAALPILYGDNIGTCVTSLLSSVGASRNARRAAVMHLSFNVIGTIIFMLILNKPISAIVTHFDPTDTARQIANAHTLFNLTNVIILLPFSKYIVKLASKLIPIKETESEVVNNTKYLDERMFSTPSIALGNTVQEVVRMGHKATNSLEHAIAGFLNKSSDDINKTFESEKVVNKLQKDILNYLLKLSKEPLRDDERFRTDLLFNTVNDIERVSDHAENIAELAMSVKEMNISFSDSAIKEIYQIYNKTMTNFKDALIVLDVKDFELANKVLEVENEVNYLEKTFRNSHMIRLNNGSCTIDAGVLYLDLLTNLERISDHSTNIVKQVLKLKQKI